MRVGFEEIAILDRARLALVAVDRHQPRAGHAQHGAPFARGREAGATAAAQARLVERVDHLLAGDLALAEPLQQRVAAGGAVGVEIDIGRHDRVVAMLRHRLGDRHRIGMVDVAMPDLGDRRGIAAADAGRAHHADLRAETTR